MITSNPLLKIKLAKVITLSGKSKEIVMFKSTFKLKLAKLATLHGKSLFEIHF